MQTMQETIALLEREMKTAAAALAKAELDERRGGISSGGSPADLELMLGVLEDKLMATTQALEETRRLCYLPAAEGYSLRFSYADTFLGFKELLLEQFSCLVTLVVKPGVGADGQTYQNIMLQTMATNSQVLQMLVEQGAKKKKDKGVGVVATPDGVSHRDSHY